MEEPPVIDPPFDDPQVLQAMYSATTTAATTVFNSSTSKTNGSPWNAGGFASILDKEMFTYRFSWEPLIEALRTLGAGLGQQENQIYGLQSSQEDMMETLKQRFGSCKEELNQVDKNLRQDMAHLYEQLTQLSDQQTNAIQNSTPSEDQLAQWKKEIMKEVREEFKAALGGILPHVTVPRAKNDEENADQSVETVEVSVFGGSLKTYQNSVDDSLGEIYENNQLYASQLASLDSKLQDVISQLGSNTSSAATTTTTAPAGASTSQLEQEIQFLQESIEKKDKEIKDLQSNVDNLLLQSQTWFANGSTSNDTNTRAPGGEVHGHTNNQGLDLSLIFTKLADLRRNADASIDELNDRLKDLRSKTEEHEQSLTTLNLYMNEQVPENQLTLLTHSLEMEEVQVHGQQSLQDQIRPALQHALEAAEGDKMDVHLLSKEYQKARQVIEPLACGTNSIKRRVQQVKLALSQLIETPSAAQDFYLSIKSQLGQADTILQANIVTEQQNESLLRTLEALRVKLEQAHYSSNQESSFDTPEEDTTSSTSIQESSEPTIRFIDASNIDSHSLHQEITSLHERLTGTLKRLSTLEHTLESLRNNQEQADNTRRPSSEASADSKDADTHSGASEQDLLDLRTYVFAEISKLSNLLDNLHANSNGHKNASDTKPQNPYDTKPQIVQTLVTQMHTKEGHQLAPDEIYESMVKEITKKVTDSMLRAAEVKGQSITSPASRGASAFGTSGLNNITQNRQMLENFLQKVDTKLNQARDSTSQELHHVKKDLDNQLRLKLEAALRDLRAELMIYYPMGNGDDFTAIGSKPSICVACSRPVPVTPSIRDAGVYPPAEAVAEQLTHALDPTCEHHQDPEFVYRAGFRMPVNETRKGFALPVVSYTGPSHRGPNSSKSKPEHGSVGKQPRGLTRFHYHAANNHHRSRVDNVVREAEDLDRVLRQNHPHSQHH